MDICDQAPAEGAPRALVLVPVEQILCELLGSRHGLAQVLGPGLDQGASLAAVVRMAAPREVDAVLAQDARLSLLAPPIEGPVRRLGERLAAGEFPLLAASLARMVLRELMSQRRLRPGDAVGEIEILRVLAMALTATAGRLLTLEEVQTAFIERSKGLVAADFVAAYVKDCANVLSEAERLTRLCENVTGGANKRAAARWLDACVVSLRFETEMRARTPGATPPGQRLMALAELQRGVRKAGLSERETQGVVEALGAIGGAIEADARLTAQLARAPAPVPQKLAVLLRLAAGETGPSGPVAERARAGAGGLNRRLSRRCRRYPDASSSCGTDSRRRGGGRGHIGRRVDAAARDRSAGRPRVVETVAAAAHRPGARARARRRGPRRRRRPSASPVRRDPARRRDRSDTCRTGRRGDPASAWAHYRW